MDLFDLWLNWDFYVDHWRGFLGLILVIGGLVLAFGPFALIGISVAGVGLLLIIWEIFTWFDRD